MNQIEFCACSSPMSIFEREHYGKCTACHQAEMKKAEEERKLQRQREEEKRKAEIQSKRQEALAAINRELSLLHGKTIQEAVINSWSEIPFGSASSTDVVATSIKITCTDGTEAWFEMDSRGCCEEYDHFIGIDIVSPKTENTALRQGCDPS